MLNLAVVPLMLVVGALTANLNELIRGETAEHRPDMVLGRTTFTLAAVGFSLVWFALLITAISTGGGSNMIDGIEVIVLFALGLALYWGLKMSNWLSDGVQIWLYRLSVPMFVVSCYIVAVFG